MVEVLVLNDEAALNLRYRGALMAAITEAGHLPRSAGLFSKGRLEVGSLWKLLARLRAPVLSSNLRANVVALAAFWVPGLVILNGMGRFRNRPALRRLLVALVRINLRKDVACQNYADYRFLRRYAGAAHVHWVPGSGGTARETGHPGTLCAVQRASKLPLVWDSLAGLMTALPSGKKLVIVGCSEADAPAAQISIPGIVFGGFVVQDRIFAEGDHFVQPEGYGEGIPHTLVDALCSGMTVLIADKEYLRYGLNRMEATRRRSLPGWSEVPPSPALAEAVGIATVTRSYMALLERHLPR